MYNMVKLQEKGVLFPGQKSGVGKSPKNVSYQCVSPPVRTVDADGEIVSILK